MDTEITNEVIKLLNETEALATEFRARLEAFFQKFIEEARMLHAQLISLKELLRKEQQKLQMEKRIQENMTAAANKVVLNIGGKSPESDGSYFIDRNPTQFDILLDYLREGKLPATWKELNDNNLRQLKGHFEYFGIPVPLELRTRLQD